MIPPGPLGKASVPSANVSLRLGLVVLVAAGLALSACGRRGSPEPPPGQRAPAGTLPANPDRPNGVRAPDQTFVLDPLL